MIKNYKSVVSTWGALAALSLAVSMTSCKNSDEASDTKSLDNFTAAPGEALTVNHCGFDYSGESLGEEMAAWAQAIQAPNTKLKNAVIGVLQGIPDNLARPFFAVGGKILVTSDAADLCADTLTEAERDFVSHSAEGQRACWRQAKAGSTPEIVVAATEADIHHSMLRLFAYVFSDLFTYRAAYSQDPVFASEEAKQALLGYKQARQELADALLADLETTESRNAVARMEAFREQAQERFAVFVAAEAIDSYYCSVASRDKFAKGFPKTFAAFTNSKSAHALIHQFGAPKTPK